MRRDEGGQALVPPHHARDGPCLAGHVGQAERDDQECQDHTYGDVEQHALGATSRMEYAALLAKNAAETGATRLHQNQNNQANGEDKLCGSKCVFQ